MIKQFLSVILLIPVCALAQNKMLTVEDAVMRQRSSLAPDKMAQLQFIPGTHSFSWIGKSGTKEVMIRMDADMMKADTIIRFTEFRDMINATGTDVELPERFPSITWASANEFRFIHANIWFAYQINGKRMIPVTRLVAEAENLEADTASKRFAFTVDNNVWVFGPDAYKKFKEPASAPNSDGTAKPKDFIVTFDGTFGLQNGKTVHRNEFGITKGLFWSPKGNRLAYYKLYENMITNYPIMNLNKKPAEINDTKYPFAGATSHIARVYIYDFAKKMSYQVLTGQPDEQYLTSVAFSPNEEDIYISILNREQNELKLNRYDAVTGAYVKTIFVDNHPKYVEPEHAVTFVPNSKYFIWQSSRDGHNHLYMYDLSGRFIKQLTKGGFDITELMGFTKDGRKAYYMATANSGLEKHCYTVDIESGKITAVTRNAGVHQVVFSDDGKYVLDMYSSVSIPRRIVLMTEEGAEKAMLLQATNPLIDYKHCAVKLFQIPAADKATPLNCRMILPPAFDSTKKHPVLVYLYGGPHAQMVTNSWLGGADMWLYFMAQQGYVVFTLDNRGSANRGVDFEQATFRQLGKTEREDQLEGVAWLKRQKFVDPSRMGVYGWSFGGFMSISMMTRTDAFKAGVAGGPVIDWRMYEIMYTERYMDTPQENPDGYKDADLTNYVKNLKGKLMLIHGTSDDVVVWQHSLNYIKKCVDEGVQVDYFVYPGHKHNVLGKDRVHLMQKITDYFKQNL